jgi:hypothetical protein
MGSLSYFKSGNVGKILTGYENVIRRG